MIQDIISKELSLTEQSVSNTIKLLEDGATIPFISRYRKEATGALDELQVGAIKELLTKYTALVARRETILATIESQGKLSAELRQKIEECWSATTLEDLYLPYKPKRRSRATVAREAGLEPLSNIIMAQRSGDVQRSASRFVVSGIADIDQAIAGALDIIAERVSENERVREGARRAFLSKGMICSKVAKGREGEVKYSDYFDCSTPLRKISSHRVLAMLRGQSEGVLKVSIVVDKDDLASQIERQFIRRDSSTATYMRKAITDSIKRLIYPSIEGQVMTLTKERADDGAISIFAENLRQLLFSSPLGGKRVLAIDPGFRTGCKVVVLSSEGDLLERCTIYPHPPRGEWDKSRGKIKQLVQRYKSQAIAVGDGTAGRETEELIRSIEFADKVDVFMVSEDGASVYSASQVAREEFPDEDVTIRGAVSIGRRLMDPLSELVKIDPKSIGVGQYQHSVDQGKLKERLNVVVESCVNRVGVNLNTASKQILTHVSGLSESLSQNIIEYRSENGRFSSREELLKVKRLGAKAFEQAAGFLRIKDGANPLDNSAIHPESYHIVERMAKDLGASLEELLSRKELRGKIDPKRYTTKEAGEATINDILEAMERRGLDPRNELQSFSFDSSIRSIDDLRVGMVLPAMVTNLTAFGAFADIGIKQDGLIHISQIADRYVASPSDVLRLGEQLTVKVIEVDASRGRIALSLKGLDKIGL
ncbi:MAG: Tex family protein [Rikenellaceae bacterium]